MNEFLFTSESVSEGHPDKVCDQISDAILDACLKDDPRSRVACETMVKTGMAVIAGEITTRTYVDMPNIVRDTIREIGYNDSSMGFDANTCAVLTAIEKQSPADVMATGKIYVDFGKAVVLVVGDLAKIEKDIRALGWGDVIVVDTDGNKIR